MGNRPAAPGAGSNLFRPRFPEGAGHSRWSRPKRLRPVRPSPVRLYASSMVLVGRGCSIRVPWEYLDFPWLADARRRLPYCVRDDYGNRRGSLAQRFLCKHWGSRVSLGLIGNGPGALDRRRRHGFHRSKSLWTAKKVILNFVL